MQTQQTDEINFVTFGNVNTYGRALARIEQEARNMGVFSNIWAWNENDLDADFVATHGSFLRSSRGYGYWIWKPQVVLQALRKTPSGSVVVYADAGCVLKKEGVLRLQEYIRMARDSTMGILGFYLPGILEKQYSKMDTIQHIFPNPTEGIYNSNQRVGGIHVWVSAPSTIAFAEEWLSTCIRDGYKYVSDVPSGIPNLPGFVDHRHDQSIFSLLSKKYNVSVIEDETWHPQWHQYSYPIFAARKRN